MLLIRALLARPLKSAPERDVVHENAPTAIPIERDSSMLSQFPSKAIRLFHATNLTQMAGLVPPHLREENNLTMALYRTLEPVAFVADGVVYSVDRGRVIELNDAQAADLVGKVASLDDNRAGSMFPEGVPIISPIIQRNVPTPTFTPDPDPGVVAPVEAPAPKPVAKAADKPADK
ncbi:hypothetical protein JRC04_04830 [Mycolicibacterium sp. S2-37]|uniref:hypothetical protein n=1 Tax=Mycolicibacterium sp. S2-37 TaxID=2810297 RepID=UPI001A94870D|nr:hypothetical protein [Mycolicibacterium sp. S2-37]MBO0676784.1 hypothetical protein [Mycolicibacterium sp. S2-37]